ncbi:MAG: type II secretion system protein [Fimbriimonadaceae bacterium]
MKKAFTLVELLVVIGIIGLLAAIVFPILSNAKLAAKDVASNSNLSQIGKAYLIYCSEYDDRTPYVAETSIMVRLQRGLASYGDYPQYVGQIQIKQALFPYVQAEDIWRSPSDPGDSDDYAVSAYSELGTSYDTLYTSFCTGSLTGLRSPSESGLLREGRFRRNRAYTWRSDGSTKLLSWPISSSQMDNSLVDFGCN